MRSLLLAGLFSSALAAAPLAPLPVWEGAPPAEALKAKPGQDSKGIINKNNAARRKSRLMKKLNAATA